MVIESLPLLLALLLALLLLHYYYYYCYYCYYKGQTCVVIESPWNHTVLLGSSRSSASSPSGVGVSARESSGSTVGQSSSRLQSCPR